MRFAQERFTRIAAGAFGLLLALAVPVAVGAQVPPPVGAQRFPIGERWTAVSLGATPYGEPAPSFQLSAQSRLAGFSGCNSFSTPVRILSDGRFGVGPIAATRRACPAAIMARERTFLMAIATARRWRLDERLLILSTRLGDLRLRRGL